MAAGILLLFILVPLIFGVPILLGLVIYLLVRNKNSGQTDAAPARSNDKTLVKILIAVLVIPIVLVFLIIFLIVFISTVKASSGYSTGYGAMPVAEYLETSNQRKTVEDWLLSCTDTSDSACYVLQYTPKQDTAGDYQYLIYIPGASGYINMDTDLTKKLFSDWRFRVEIQCAEDSAEQLLFLVTYIGTDSPEEIDILYNGQEMEEEVTYTRQPLEDKQY